MPEVEPHETRRSLGGIAHQMVVIGPNEGDKQIAHQIAEPCRPERQQRFEGRKLWGVQIQDEHSYENCEHPVGERAQPLRGPSSMWHDGLPSREIADCGSDLVTWGQRISTIQST